jgi:hypothetical protein
MHARARGAERADHSGQERVGAGGLSAVAFQGNGLARGFGGSASSASVGRWRKGRRSAPPDIVLWADGRLKMCKHAASEWTDG